MSDCSEACPENKRRKEGIKLMSSRVGILYEKRLITPPKWLPTSVQYETMMGSVAYGVSTDHSDVDVYGFCIPRKDIIFPHLAGVIKGFGQQGEKFDQFQQHHIKDRDNNKEYDLSIYNIVKYFQLCMENNPNVIDSLYTPRFCVLHSTKIGEIVRENRDLFLHKGSWFKFKGYAYSQLHKLKNKKPKGKRLKRVEKYGYDTKFAYHTVRLLDEAEQILKDHTINLQRNKEHLKAIRRGDISEEDILKWSHEKEAALEKAYEESTLRHSPDEKAIKRLLLNCLEEHYGDLSKVVVEPDQAMYALREISKVLEKNRGLL